MMCQMQKNAQSFGTIFGVSEWSKDLERETERQRESKWRASSKKSEHNLGSLHERVSSQMNRILMGEDDLPEWMIHGRTVLCQKDRQKGNTADNYRPITCLPFFFFFFFFIYIYILMNQWTFTTETKILNQVEFITII